MDSHARRSPAVRARHHGKRLPADAFDEKRRLFGFPAFPPISSIFGNSGGSDGDSGRDGSGNNGSGNGGSGNGDSGRGGSGNNGSGKGSSDDDDENDNNKNTKNTTSKVVKTTPVAAVNPEPSQESVPATTSSTVNNPATPSTTSSTTSTISSTSSASSTSIAATTPTTSASVTSSPDTNSAPSTTSLSSPSISPSAEGISSASSASSKPKGVPAVAIGVIVTLIVLAILSWAVFIIRKRYMRKREMKRMTWGAGVFAKHNNITPSMSYKTLDATSITSASAPPTIGATSFGTYGAAMARDTPPFSLASLPMTYNSVAPLSPVAPSMAPGATAAVGMARTAASGPSDAFVRCTFIPSLPDELSITTGDTVRVVAAYDDGWALCAKSSGEQGMVPLECLDRSPRNSIQYPSQGQSDWRNSRRISSLATARY